MMKTRMKMYTLYPDLAKANHRDNSTQLEKIMELQAHLDSKVFEWIQKNNIGSFPKPYSEFCSVRDAFVRMSRVNKFMRIIFVELVEEIPVKYHVLSDGSWSQFASMEDIVKVHVPEIESDFYEIRFNAAM